MVSHEYAAWGVIGVTDGEGGGCVSAIVVVAVDVERGDEKRGAVGF